MEATGRVEVRVEMRTGRGWSSGKGQRLGERWRPGERYGSQGKSGGHGRGEDWERVEFRGGMEVG